MFIFSGVSLVGLMRDYCIQLKQHLNIFPFKLGELIREKTNRITISHAPGLIGEWNKEESIPFATGYGEECFPTLVLRQTDLHDLDVCLL